ncbi:hypothetical protein FIBSPDRAFT_430812 [Athelia psychrophila]|uniref:Uncharacterized protein n=1 Tax=Athelia psychrophila TaxID=1759441 RepID=A0A166MLR9_9AGAM|nr:hypothetical protein FIBSPDRAFT_430812 [Fibularhizoctonia sp. CBS 109695]
MRQVNQTRISTLSKRLKAIDRTKKELTRQLQELEVESIAKRNELHSLRNEDAPISSLPNEVLSMIFEIGQKIPRGYSIQGVLSFEIAVSHVTSHWRYVALGTPALWTHITRTEFRQKFDLISAYLRRSEPLPFDLRIFIGRDDMYSSGGFGEEMEDIGPFFDLIKPYLERCGKLFITAREYVGGIALLRLLSPISASSLNSFRVFFHGQRIRGDTINIFQGGAHALKHLELGGLQFVFCNLPTSNLTALRLGDFTWPRKPSEFHNICASLSGMHLLSHLHLDSTYADIPWPFDVPITLPALRSIAYLASATHISALLLALDAPLLEGVSLEFGEGDSVLDEALSLHCPSKFPSVRRLGLTFDEEEDENEVSIGSTRTLALAFPLITTLAHPCNEAYVVATRLHEFFAFLQDDGGVWPHMTTLQIPLSFNTILPKNDLKETLVHRANAGYPIRTITLPEIHLEQGLSLASCVQPPPQVIRYTDDTPFPFPGGSIGGFS